MSSNSMDRAWAAGRRLVAVTVVGMLLSAALVEAETLAHIQSGFLHVMAVLLAFLVSIVLVHGFGILEPLGF